MKSKLFEEGLHSEREIVDAMDADCHEIEDGFKYVKQFSDDEVTERKEMFFIESKKVNDLGLKLKDVADPIKAQMKEADAERKALLHSLNKGGVEVTGKVWLFPDYEAKLMGIYDSTGTLVDTRSFTQKERQLSMNSHKTIHLNQKEA